MSVNALKPDAPAAPDLFRVKLPLAGPISRDEFFAPRTVPGLRPCKRLGLGTAGLAGVWGEVSFAESIAVMRAAWAGGFLLTDSAPLYGDGKGDQLLGEAMMHWTGEQPIALTKLEGYPEFAPPTLAADWHGALAKQFETSRRQFGRRIDGLAMHDAEMAPTEFQQPCISFLQEQKKAGHVGAIGFGGGRPTIQLRWLKSVHLDYVITFKRVSAVTLQGLTDIVPAARERGMAVIAASPVVMGLLGSKYEEYHRERPDHIPAVFIERAGKVKTLCASVGIAMPHLAMRFLLSVPGIDFVLTGACTLAEWEDARAAYEAGPLPADLYAAVWRLAQEGDEPLCGG